MKEKITALENSNEPFLLEIRNLKAQINSLVAEKTILQEEISRWMKKVENLIHSYNQVDLAEHEQLQEEFKEVSLQKQNLESKLENFESDAESRIAAVRSDLEDQMQKRQEEYKALSAKELERARSLSKMIREKNTEISSLKERLAKLPSAGEPMASHTSEEVNNLIAVVEKSKKVIAALEEKIRTQENEFQMKLIE
jgi:chromosome segregation ATPase